MSIVKKRWRVWRPSRRFGKIPRSALAAADAERTLHCLIERLKQADSPPTNDLSFLRPARKPGLLGMLGPYEVLEEIGRGGMGVVLKAHDATLDRVVAIKVLSPFLASSADARRRFKREVQAAAAVCHENVVAVHGVDEADVSLTSSCSISMANLSKHGSIGQGRWESMRSSGSACKRQLDWPSRMPTG